MATSTSGCDTPYCAETSDGHAEHTEPFAEAAVDSAEHAVDCAKAYERSSKLSGDGSNLIDGIAGNPDDYAVTSGVSSDTSDGGANLSGGSAEQTGGGAGASGSE